MRSGKSPSRGTSSLTTHQRRPLGKTKPNRSTPAFSPSIRSTVVHESRVYNFAGLPDVELRRSAGKTHCHHRPLPMFFFFPSIRSAPLNVLSLYLWLNERRPSTMFIRKQQRLCSTTVRCPSDLFLLRPAAPRRRLVLLVLASTFSPLIPEPLPPPPRRRLTAETCITDSSKLLLLIALLGDIVESRVTVFTSGRRGGCYKLFKSFYYTMPIYILAMSLIQKEGRRKSRIIVFQL